ncbi:hypothetical protein RKD28_000349 [Streptomyces sp. SAI-229]|jgi:hypothetical protein
MTADDARAGLAEAVPDGTGVRFDHREREPARDGEGPSLFGKSDAPGLLGVPSSHPSLEPGP